MRIARCRGNGFAGGRAAGSVTPPPECHEDRIEMPRSDLCWSATLLRVRNLAQPESQRHLSLSTDRPVTSDGAYGFVTQPPGTEHKRVARRHPPSQETHGSVESYDSLFYLFDKHHVLIRNVI